MNRFDLYTAASHLSDDDLRALNRDIVDLLKSRYRLRASTVASTLSIGDRVRLAGTIRPVLLQGRMATVKAVSGGKVTVDLDYAAGPTGRWHRGIRIPAQLLTKVSHFDSVN
jgi:hypothetical protein